jgi:hypothetical protein
MRGHKKTIKCDDPLLEVTGIIRDAGRGGGTTGAGNRRGTMTIRLGRTVLLAMAVTISLGLGSRGSEAQTDFDIPEL